MANLGGSNRFVNNSRSAGRSFRLARSPVIPKMTNIVGWRVIGSVGLNAGDVMSTVYNRVPKVESR